MRKKVLSIILGMAMLSGVLAGCGSNGGDTVQNNTAAESEASAETVDPDTENTETESEETQYLADIQFTQKTKTKIMKYREDNDSVLLFYEKRI